MKIRTRIEIPAPQAYSIKLKYGIALNTAIIFSGNVQTMSAASAGELTPTKKPFKKLKSHCKGVKSNVNKDAMFDITYRRTLKKSKAMCAKSSIFLVSSYRRDYGVEHNQSDSDADDYCKQGRQICNQTSGAGKHRICHSLSPIDKHICLSPEDGPASQQARPVRF
ncbi:MAG TPA: hypothetical protein PKZ12_02885 [Smithellaceae bacterium]|nr:hypothetical protein [Smithellaceae bacterium]